MRRHQNPGQRIADDVSRQITQPVFHRALLRIKITQLFQGGHKRCLRDIRRQIGIAANAIENKRVERPFVDAEPVRQRSRITLSNPLQDGLLV